MPRRLSPSLAARRARCLMLLAGLPAFDARGAEPLAVTLAGEASLPITLVLAADAPPLGSASPETQVVTPGSATATPLVPTTAPPPPVVRPQRVPADTSALVGQERAPLSPAGTPTVPPGAGPEAVPLPYTVTVNGRRFGDAVLLQLRDGRLLARREDLARWRLSPPPGTPFVLQDQTYYSLDTLPGYRVELDAARQRAELTFAPTAFQLSRLVTATTTQTIAKKPQALGVVLNYDILGTHVEGFDGPGNDTLSGFGDVSVSDSWGVLSTNFAATNLVDRFNNDSRNGARRVVRLETTYTRDDPATLRTLVLGDTVSGAGLLSRPVRLGGVRFARNFGTQPGFVTFPQPALTGEAALPSVVEVFVNGVQQQRQSIAPGPFQLDAVPSINGQGDVQLVVRDILGREQVISQSYFTGSRQLGRGLSDFSYEAGFLRRNLGVKDSDYANLVALGTQRYGFTDRFTGEAHVEFVDNGLQGASVGGIYGIYPFGVITGGLGVSNSSAGTGVQGLVGFSRVVRRAVSFGVQYIAASSDYRVVGLNQNVGLPSRQLSSNVSFSLGRYGGLGIGYFNIRTRGNFLGADRGQSSIAGGTLFDPSARGLGITTEFYTASLSTNILGVGTNLIATRRVQPERDLTLSLRGVVPLGGRRYGQLLYQQRRDASGNNTGSIGAGFQNSRSSDLGVGYGVQVRRAHGDFVDDDVQVDASAEWDARYASTAAAVAYRDQGTSIRAGVGGAIGTFAGHTFATRHINSGFAVVETGVEGIDLTVQSQPTARTDADGVAVLPRLQAYNLNRVQIDPSNLPINVAVPYDAVDATPYFRSGLLIAMPATVRHTAVALLARADGRPVPAGATFTVGDVGSPVGRKGLVYLGDVPAGVSTGTITWADQRCTVSISLPDTADFQYDLGTLKCREPTQ